jgi:hypothetical protein
MVNDHAATMMSQSHHSPSFSSLTAFPILVFAALAPAARRALCEASWVDAESMARVDAKSVGAHRFIARLDGCRDRVDPSGC